MSRDFQGLVWFGRAWLEWDKTGSRLRFNTKKTAWNRSALTLSSKYYICMYVYVYIRDGLSY